MSVPVTLRSVQDFSFVPSLSRARMPPLPVVCWRLRRFLTAARAAMRRSYNHLRHYESIGNLTPANVYFGRVQIFLIERERIKRQTIANRRLLHRRKAAYHYKSDEPETLLFYAATCPKNFDDRQPSVCSNLLISDRNRNAG